MKKIKWYINRAKIMNRKEIIHRILCKKYDKKIQSGYRLKEENYSLNFIELPKFNGIDENTDKIILNSCDKILNNKIDIFNMTLDLNYEDKFLKDPFSRKLWSKELYTKIDFRGDDLVGDPKIIWEINKQQYLLDLGIAYRITGDEKYAEKVIDEINEWINQNPLYIGINWTSNLEIALRCLTWIFSLSLIKQYVEKNNVCISNISHYLRCKSNFIYNKLSLYSSANNHLIGELTLLLYSSFFIECNESDQWRKKSISMLNEQVKKQFYSDGINKEQSINYQIHTMELYFLCQYLLDINNMKLNEDTIEVLKKACFYLNKLSIKNGDIFNIGDEDGGHILRLQNKSSSVLQILQFASILLEDNYIYEGKDKYIDYKILMLFGNKYLSFLESNLKFKNNSEKTYIFNEGGMYIRDGKLNNISYKCMLDFGNIGMAPLNAHAHCDILSFNLNLDQQSFLIDCGTYKYHKDDGFRDYFRGVGAHNTISIDDENQFAFLGKFMCSKSPNTRINEITDNSIDIVSDMFKKKKCKVNRIVKFEDNSIFIIDKIVNNSNTKRKVSIYYNFSPNVEIIKKNNTYECLINKKVVILRNCNDDIEVKSKNKKNNVDRLGFISEQFYDIKSTEKIIFNAFVEAKSMVEIITQIQI